MRHMNKDAPLFVRKWYGDCSLRVLLVDVQGRIDQMLEPLWAREAIQLLEAEQPCTVGAINGVLPGGLELRVHHRRSQRLDV